jgi:hypothetical protein
MNDTTKFAIACYDYFENLKRLMNSSKNHTILIPFELCYLFRFAPMSEKTTSGIFKPQTRHVFETSIMYTQLVDEKSAWSQC